MSKQSFSSFEDNSLLVKGNCEPCESGTKPMEQQEVVMYLTLLKTPWSVEDEGKLISKQFKFKDFKEAMVFVNKLADLAEEQGHHPNIKISYNKVKLELTTHAIGGLSLNDFIIAAKIEEIRK